jgi:DNA-binding transcriptional ArsR family regulator
MDPDRFHRISKALADPRRMEILESIRRQVACAAFCSKADVSQATMTHHLKELITAGLDHDAPGIEIRFLDAAKQGRGRTTRRHPLSYSRWRPVSQAVSTPRLRIKGGRIAELDGKAKARLRHARPVHRAPRDRCRGRRRGKDRVYTDFSDLLWSVPQAGCRARLERQDVQIKAYSLAMFYPVYRRGGKTYPGQ